MISPTFESPEGMAKTVDDLAGLIKIIVSTTDSPLQLPAQLPMTWSNFSLGFVDPKLWQLPSFLLAPDEEYSKQMISSYEAAIDKIKTLGGHIWYSVPLVHPSELQFGGNSGYLTILSLSLTPTYKRAWTKPITSKLKRMTSIRKPRNEARQEMKRRAGEEGIDKILSEFGVDAIVALMDSPISTVAALAGYPSATVPLGYHLQSGRPFALCLVARANEEGKLLEMINVYEATSPKRQLPHLLYDSEPKI
ncbi:MAG: hypothetical protein Q9192_001519 [Flavoplaca navasiana]